MENGAKTAGGILENLIPTIIDGGQSGTIAALLLVLLVMYFAAKKVVAVAWTQLVVPHLPQNARPADPSAAVVAEIRALDARFTEALRTHAENSSEGRRRLHERIDAMGATVDSRVARIEQRFDTAAATFATRAEVEAQVRPLQTVCEHAIEEAGRLVSELRRMVNFAVTQGKDVAPD